MQFCLLGPLEVRVDGGVVALGGLKPRALLAVLLLQPNEPVSAERLAFALWGNDAAPAAVKTVQVHVSRLRRALGDADVLATTRAGYRLRVRSGELDIERFDRLVGDGRRVLASGDGARAGVVLREALSLWRGPPLAEFGGMPFAPAEIARLEEERVAAVELRVEADLVAGRESELVGELRRLTEVHPWRERLHAQQMLALYRSGRQAEALEAYRAAREVLVDQLGIEPGSELSALHQAILAHDPGLGLPSGVTPASFDGLAARGRRPLLPAPPNRTVGRERELAALRVRLDTPATRLVTLTGPGGVGKTRLALEAARAAESGFADGARFVDLAGVHKPEDVPTAMLASLEITVLAAETAADAVARFLGPHRLLLVLDNCEHVLAAMHFIGRLLASCPGLTVLATSREPLDLRAEERWPVPPLAVPDADADDSEGLTGNAAVGLFVERARAHDPDLELSDGNTEAVVEICRRVDGLPLAIELAAARCALLSPLEIAQHLDAALGPLGAGPRDAPTRQRTLRATIDWSYDLLTADEQACFARFAVFAGGATIDAAAAVTAAQLTTLDRLVAKSLLTRRRPASGTRLLMLETIRTYAEERLAADPGRVALRERHYRHYLAFAERFGSERALGGAANRDHLRRLDAEADNLRRALGWAAVRGDPEQALRLTAALGWYWLHRTRYDEAVRWIDRALGLHNAGAHQALVVRVLCIKALCQWPLGHSAGEGHAILADAVRVARALRDPLLLSQALQLSAERHAAQNELQAADALADEALHWATIAGDAWQVANTSRAKTATVSTAADLRERVGRSARLLEEAGNLHQLAGVLAASAYVALCIGADTDARVFIERAVPIADAMDTEYLSMLVQGNLGLTDLFTGDTHDAARAFRKQLELCRETVALTFACEGLLGLAALAAARGDSDRAARLSGAAAAHRYGHQQDAIEARIDETFLAHARARATATAWETAMKEGTRLGFREAIAYALDQADARVPVTEPLT